jgi:hypothetical protein
VTLAELKQQVSASGQPPSNEQRNADT